MPGCHPLRCSACATAITVGVLPAPPTTQLPTTSTGTGACQGRRQPQRQGPWTAQRTSA
jgi:hypothetical protein